VGRRRGKYAERLERLYFDRSLSPKETKEEFLKLLMECRNELGKRCYQAIGLALDRLYSEYGPNPRIKLLWDAAYSQSPEFLEALRNFYEKLITIGRRSDEKVRRLVNQTLQKKYSYLLKR